MAVEADQWVVSLRRNGCDNKAVSEGPQVGGGIESLPKVEAEYRDFVTSVGIPS